MGHYKILIADPEPFVRDTLKQKLTSRGYKVFTVDTGQECIRIAREEAVNLIVMEIAFSDMDGIKVCQELSSNRTDPVPIIILTSKPGTPENKFTYNAWANEFLTKPFSPNALVKAVEKILASSAGKSH